MGIWYDLRVHLPLVLNDVHCNSFIQSFPAILAEYSSSTEAGIIDFDYASDRCLLLGLLGGLTMQSPEEKRYRRIAKTNQFSAVDGHKIHDKISKQLPKFRLRNFQMSIIFVSRCIATPYKDL